MNELCYKYTLNIGGNLFNARFSKKLLSSRYNWTTPRHCNAEYELHLLLGGEVNVEVEEKHYFVRAGEGIIIAPGKYHIPLENFGEMEHLSIGFSLIEGEIADILLQTIPCCSIFPLSADMIAQCRDIYREYTSDAPYSNEKIRALTTCLIISALRNLNILPKKAPSLSLTELERADIIDNFFSERLKDRLGLQELADLLHLSRRQTGRVLYQLYGMTFQEKLTRAKMDRAAWLIRTTDKKTAQITEAVGYMSEAAFYQAFRKYFGMTPQKYRNFKK